jgi:DNA (cytosine-5)-methyltransferase 1
MNVLDLFSGIGGFSLGLERAGMRTVAFCEIDPYCRRVLHKHWPDVPVFGDVRNLTAKVLANTIGNTLRDQPRRRDGARGTNTSEPQHNGSQWIDVIAGGFPCQDISVAGKGAGLGGEHSGLWSEYARIIGEVRPRYVIVENVAALLGRGLARVLGDLAALGFDAEWHCIPASAVGAPHRRDRIWIVAYACDPGRRRQSANGGMANSVSERSQGSIWTKLLGLSEWEHQPSGGSSHWLAEPDVGRVAHGVSNRVDRLRALGNAVVPQIPEIIGRAIMNAEHQRTYRPAHQVGCAVPLRTWAPSPNGELS